jgi:hypothetical protein
MLDCDGHLWTCFIWSLWIWMIVDQTFVVINLCHQFLNLCPSCEFVKFWRCESADLLCVDMLYKFAVINLFWLRSVRPEVLATLWTLHQSCHSVWCDWCNTVAPRWVMPDSLVQLSRATNSVYTAASGRVASDGMTRLHMCNRISLPYSRFDLFLIIFCKKIGIWSLNKSGSCLHVLHILKISKKIGITKDVFWVAQMSNTTWSCNDT